MPENRTVQPVILCGGSGTRLWPLSREAYPKQFIPLVGEYSLLQETLKRLQNPRWAAQQVTLQPPIIVTNEAHRFLVLEQLRSIQVTPKAIILEPTGKNTAPALTLAALAADPDDILLVMPADHYIVHADLFVQQLLSGLCFAQTGQVVTFGIVPDRPETGYGYLQKGAALNEVAVQLAQFVEKPPLEVAMQYLASGEYVWNSGIFVLTGAVWLHALRLHRPDIAQQCADVWQSQVLDDTFIHLQREAFERISSESIDYAVMEKLDTKGDAAPVLILLDVGWSDVGSWSALHQIESSTENDGNVVRGDVFTQASHDNLVFAQHRLVAAIGVEDLMIVETADAVLVANKSHAQDVKAVTAYLKAAKRSEHVYHQKVHRPWGCYESIDAGARFQVKRLSVNPGAVLSLQLHHHRAEHWVVVKGTAKITRGEEVSLLTENQSTYIPLGTQHRLENPGVIPLEIIEIQSGSYLGEDDIVRFEDRYNR